VTRQLSDDDKFQQDVAFLKELGKKSEYLTGFSLYMWWFPTELQEVLEMLMFRKPLDGDVGGLLSLIMCAYIDINDDIFFEMQVIQKAFLPKTKDGANNLLFESWLYRGGEGSGLHMLLRCFGRFEEGMRLLYALGRCVVLRQ
jgi:hypothetical protein